MPTIARVSPAGTLSIVGGIDVTMVAAVRKALGTATRPIRKVNLDSFGGDVDAMRELVKLLSPLKAVTEVPAGDTCQSACIGLLAYASGPIIVAPTATLMFHSAAKRFGLAGSGLCGALNIASARVGMALQWLGALINRLLGLGGDNRPVMLPWAERLSDKLPALFAACRRNPLQTSEGITLAGAEFNALRDGSVRPEQLVQKCPPS